MPLRRFCPLPGILRPGHIWHVCRSPLLGASNPSTIPLGVSNPRLAYRLRPGCASSTFGPSRRLMPKGGVSATGRRWGLDRPSIVIAPAIWSLVLGLLPPSAAGDCFRLVPGCILPRPGSCRFWSCCSPGLLVPHGSLLHLFDYLTCALT